MDDIRALPVKDMANVKRKWALSRSDEREILYLITVGCKLSSSASKAWADPFKKSPPHFQAGIFQGYRFCSLAVCQHGTLINLD
jgi:hypothetical protein